MAPISSTLALGAGCFWGTEKYIVKDFQQKFPNSIQHAEVGYMSPDKDAMKNPSYRQVCSGSTGHVEVLKIELADAARTPELFESLIQFFFSFHDPTTLNRQGNDAGTQYASVIFVSDETQKTIANKVKTDLQKALDNGTFKRGSSSSSSSSSSPYSLAQVTTGVVDYTVFFPAEQEHQEYLFKNPNGYCNHRYRFRDWPEL